MDAPKKIWIIRDRYVADPEQTCEKTTPYIREDVVLELVEALKYCMRYNGYDFDETPAEVSLKKLEDV